MSTTSTQPVQDEPKPARPPVDANELERMARARPNDCFLKGSGILKLTGGIRDLEGRLGVAVGLLREVVGPLEVSAAVIESEDGGDAIEALLQSVKRCIEQFDHAAIGMAKSDELPDADCPAFYKAFEETAKHQRLDMATKGYGYRSPTTQLCMEVAFGTVNRLRDGLRTGAGR
jgi:hypothetical protein